MLRNLFLFMLALTACVAALPEVRADDDAVIPAGTQVDRYRPIWTRSPFTLASVEQPQASADWNLAGLAENGKDPLVFLVNRQSQERMIVTSTPNEKGFSVESVDYQADLLQSSVRVKTPGETLTIRFDPSAIAVQAAPAPGAPQGMPVAPPVIPDAHRRIMPRIIIPNPLPGNPSLHP